MKKISIQQIQGIPENLEALLQDMQSRIAALEKSNEELRKASLASLSKEEVQKISSEVFSSDSGTI